MLKCLACMTFLSITNPIANYFLQNMSTRDLISLRWQGLQLYVSAPVKDHSVVRFPPRLTFLIYYSGDASQP